MNDAKLADLARRLERLETANRRWKRLGMLSLAGLATVLAMSQGVPRAVATAPEPPLPLPRKAADVVEAHQFVLRDKSGVIRATLAMSKDGEPVLMFLDPDERIRAVLAQSELHLSGANSSTAVKVIVNADGRPALRLEKDGKLRAVLGMTADGVLALGLYDQEGKGRALLDVSADGSPGLALFNQSGKVTWSTAR